jgi:hypothetical protein
MIIHELGSLIPKTHDAEYRQALMNPAVAHCRKTWERVYRSVYKEKDSKTLARVYASLAFRGAMPPLVGDQNIRNFIACVTFGLATEIFLEEVASKLLYAAQVAYNTGSPRNKKSAKIAPNSRPKSSVSSPLTPKTTPLPLPPAENSPEPPIQ